MTEPAPPPPTRRAPLGVTERLCWVVLGYAAAPVVTVLFSAFGVSGWVHAQHGPVQVSPDAVSLGGLVLIAFGVFSVGVVMAFSVASGRAWPPTVTLVGGFAAVCWMTFAAVGVAGPDRVLNGWRGNGALVVVLAVWAGVFHLEAAARRVLRDDVSIRAPEPAGHDTRTGRR